MNKLEYVFKFGSLSSVWVAVGFSLVFTLGLTYIISSLFFLLGMHLSYWPLVIGFIASELILQRSCTKSCFLWSAISAILIWAVAIMVGAMTSDCSWDGIGYHQPTIFALSDGWNPIWDNSYDKGLIIWTIHYAKALEVISACVYSLTGEMEAGKAVNFIFAVAVFLFSVNFVKSFEPGLSKWKVAVFSLLTVGNPVFLSQSFNYYIDYALYFYLVLSIFFSAEICEKRNVLLCKAGLFIVIVLAIGTKFNHFFIVGVAIFAILMWLVVTGKKESARSIFVISLLSGVFGVLVVGFHPYLTNWINYGNPFYPLMGDGAIDIMTANTPELYFGNGRIANFILSIYGPVSLPEFDSRISGFGPFFKILFSIAIGWIIYYEVRNKRLSVVGYATVIVLCSCFFFEQSWWARYNPQVWMIVPMAYYLTLTKAIPGSWLINRGVALLGVSNVILTVLIALLTSLKLVAYRDSVFEVLEGKEVRSHVGKMWKLKLESKGITPVVVDEDVIPEPNRTPLLHVPEYPIRYIWVETTSDEQKQILYLYEHSGAYRCEKKIRSLGKHIYMSVKQLIGWKC